MKIELNGTAFAYMGKALGSILNIAKKQNKSKQ